MDCIRQCRLDLMGWKREKLGHVQISIKEKHMQLDILQQETITASSKGGATVLARDIDKLRAVDERSKTNLITALQNDEGTCHRSTSNHDLCEISLLVNGDQVGYIKPGRGLRQGDPLSLYLFIMCTEGLISLLNGACNRGELNGILLGLGLNPLSHLMFDDDIFLLGQASIGEAMVIRDILHTYESWSGQLVNIQKSTILFSPNVLEHTRNKITGIVGMPQMTSHGKYLRLPTSTGSSKKEVFNSIIDRVKTKVDNWKSRLL
ncbi:hypothetical protein LIER_14783 [Lithospermum erythrorhizon]|uniref:Reverse transcriptase domain-containing protein n=1 Tax=Lithospermum erythrorhizon TaxID=34254 RepID=A0AAV3Q2X2_LITER